MGGVLYRDKPTLTFEDNFDVNVGFATCDALQDRRRQADSKAYLATLPTDVLYKLIAHGFCVALAITALILSPVLFEAQHVPGQLSQSRELKPWPLKFAMVTALIAGIWLILLVMQIPRRVVREPDAFILEFLVHRQVIDLDDVLELVVLNKGSQFRSLLRRWQIFPHGWTIRFFCGARSKDGAVCVLLTRRCLQNFVFSVQDPGEFLLDNQRPLDLQVVYETTAKAALRDGEFLNSERLGTIPKGRLLRVEEQRGRRVLVHLDGPVGENVIRGWMSYITTKGSTLLTRYGFAPSAGTVGASELKRITDDPMIELGLLRGGGVE